MKHIFKSLTVWTILCVLVLVGGTPAKAQSTLEYLLLALENLAKTPSATAQASHFKYEVVALDAQTNGKVTSATQQVNLLLRLTNDAPIFYGEVKVVANQIAFKNSAGAEINITNTNQPAPLPVTPITEDSSYYVLITPNPISITAANALENNLIVSVDVILAMYINAPTATTTPDGVLVSHVENLVYASSNGDALPVILNKVNNVASTEKTISTTESAILNDLKSKH